MKLCAASSLDKIFPDGSINIFESSDVMLRNERYHFQVAVKNETCGRLYGTKLSVKVVFRRISTV